jgi:hypothetical protein
MCEECCKLATLTKANLEIAREALGEDAEE